MASLTDRVYYPSCVVNLTLRFDPNFNIADENTSSAQSTANRNQTTENKPRGIPIVVQGPALSPGELGPQDLQRNQSYITYRIPKSASIELNSFRQAGTFSLTFDYRELPIDPRLLHNVAVQIYLGTVNAADFASGVTDLKSPENRRKSVLEPIDPPVPEDNKPDSYNPAEGNLIMHGLVDQADITYTDKGATLVLTGRDLRGLLLDMNFPSEGFNKVNPNQPIDKVVTQILGLLPLGDKVDVWTNAGDWEGGILPTPGQLGKVTESRQRGETGTNTAPQGSSGGNISAWDLITKECYLVGAIPFFIGRTLVIRPAKTLFDTVRNADKASPFKKERRAGESSEPFYYRKMVWGQDIEELKFERKFMGIKAPRIELVGIDPDGKGPKKAIVVTYPKKAPGRGGSKTLTAGDADSKGSEDTLRLPPIRGIKDKKQLEKIAEGLFHEIGRQEMGGSLATKTLASFGGNNADPDLLRLKPGDVIEIDSGGEGFSRSPIVDELSRFKSRPIGELIQEVAKKLGDENLARAIVASTRGRVLELANLFKVTNVKYQVDEGGAVGISCDFQNFVIARQEGERPVPSSTIPAKPARRGPKRKPTVTVNEADVKIKFLK